jgi:hypothetical protein
MLQDMKTRKEHSADQSQVYEHRERRESQSLIHIGNIHQQNDQTVPELLSWEKSRKDNPRL